MSKWKVNGVILFSGALALFLFMCLGFATMDYYREEASSVTTPATQPIEKRTNEFTVVALGDSLTRGTGDDTGKGYVGTVTEELGKKFNQKVNVRNLGIKGLVSAELAKQVKKQEVQRQLQAADVILLTIGGNDLFQKGDTLLNVNQENLAKVKTNYTMNLNEICREIRQVNPAAQLFVLGLYNPFIELDENGEMNAIVRDWNNNTAEVLATYQDVVFVPTFDLFQLSVNDYLYSDKFHPNRAGYRLIAERIVPLIELEASGDE